MDTIPMWAANLSADVASIKARTDTIPAIEKEIKELRISFAPLHEHEVLKQRLEILWDAFQRFKGAAYVFGVINVLLGTYIGAHLAHLLP